MRRRGMRSLLQLVTLVGGGVPNETHREAVIIAKKWKHIIGFSTCV